MNTISVIKRSVGCQWLGTWSLLPVIGIAFAVAAIGCYHQVRAEAGHEWNPARAELIRGAFFAWVGLAINLVAITAVLLHIWLGPSPRGCGI
jgi:hypothetical protein